MTRAFLEPGVSVVICTRNRAESLRLALDTVLRQETGGRFSYEVVVVDDASTDNTPEVVRAVGAGATVPVRHERKAAATGIAAARNLGVSAAKRRYVVFFDDDQLASPDWLARLIEVAEEHGATIVGGARNLDLSPEALARLGPICRIILGEVLFDGTPAPLEEKALPSTGNLLLDQEVFEKVGVFDEGFAASGEDTDLILRARAAGHVVWSAPRAMVAHMIPGYRLTPAYFKWVSSRWGLQFAQMDRLRGGLLRVVLAAAARFAQLSAVHFPKLLVALARGDEAAAMDRRCLMWRAIGYVRAAAALAGLFPQRGYLERLEFKREGELFGGHPDAGPAAGRRGASGA